MRNIYIYFLLVAHPLLPKIKITQPQVADSYEILQLKKYINNISVNEQKNGSAI